LLWLLAWARRFAAIKGNKGESCDLQTGQARDSAAVSRQEMTLVFAPKGIQANNVIDIVLRLFVKHGIPERGFEISKRLKRRVHPPTQIKGQGFTIEVGNDVASAQLWRSDIDAETPLRIPWDEWVIELFNEAFVSAWAADADYQFWQSAKHLSHYKTLGRPWKQLPLIPSGLPPPLDQTVVDTSHNPGRRVFHVGFIEAVGSVMWFGERFWQVSGASKQEVLSAS
jgi:hypothetical protein